MEFGVENGIAVGNGILTVDNREQAWARASVDGGNKGAAAAGACAALMELASDLERKSGR